MRIDWDIVKIERGLRFLIMFLIDTVDFSPDIFHQIHHLIALNLPRQVPWHDKFLFHVSAILLRIMGVSGILEWVCFGFGHVNVVKKLLCLFEVRILIQRSVMCLVVS